MGGNRSHWEVTRTSVKGQETVGGYWSQLEVAGTSGRDIESSSTLMDVTVW